VTIAPLHLPALTHGAELLEAELVDDDDQWQQLAQLDRQSERVREAFLLGFNNANTLDGYRRDLDQWFNFCRSYGTPPLSARRLHVNAYVRWMIVNPPAVSRHRPDPDAPHRPATIARKIAPVRGYYLYAVDEEILTRNPVPGAKRLNLPAVSRKSQTLGPDQQEAARLLSAARLRSPLDGAVVSLLLHAGLRVSEAISRNRAHLSHQRGHRVLTVLRKGGEEQDLVLAPPAAADIDTYLATREDPTGELFVDDQGEGLDRHQVAYMVETAARAAGLTKQISPHSLRHACATMLLDMEVSLRDVQIFMGHAHSTTTERYDLGREQLDKSPAYKLTGAFS
jgi:site-specific recombinase XerD